MHASTHHLFSADGGQGVHLVLIVGQAPLPARSACRAQLIAWQCPGKTGCRVGQVGMHRQAGEQPDHALARQAALQAKFACKDRQACSRMMHWWGCTGQPAVGQSVRRRTQAGLRSEDACTVLQAGSQLVRWSGCIGRPAVLWGRRRPCTPSSGHPLLSLSLSLLSFSFSLCFSGW